MKIKKNWKWILIFSIILGAILLLGTTKVNAVECSDVDKKVIINLDNLGIEGGKPELDFFWDDEGDDAGYIYSTVFIGNVKQDVLNTYASSAKQMITSMKLQVPDNIIKAEFEGKQCNIETINGKKYVEIICTLQYTNISSETPLNEDVAGIAVRNYLPDGFLEDVQKIKLYTTAANYKEHYIYNAISIASENVAFDYRTSYVNKFGTEFRPEGGRGGAIDDDKFYLQTKQDISTCYNLVPIPESYNLQDAYLQLEIDAYQGEKIEVDNLGTLYYAGMASPRYYLYKNRLSNLKHPEQGTAIIFTAKTKSGYTLKRNISMNYFLSKNAKEEEITGTIDHNRKDEQRKVQYQISGTGNGQFETLSINQSDYIYKKLQNGMNNVIKNNYNVTILDTFYMILYGQYQGNLNITFDVGTNNNNKEYIIGHLKNGLDYEYFEGTVKNGKIAIKVDSLSSFMIAIKEKKNIITDIKNCTISNIANQNYTGKEIKPNPTIKNGKVALKNGTDYTVSYKNNTKLGTATVTIKGKGNYTGTITKTFKIVIGKVAGVAAKTQTTSSITLKWNKPSGTVTGYEVYMATSKNGKYKKVATITKSKTTTYKKTKLSAGKTYYFKVKAYKTISGKKKYGSYSSVLTTTTKTKTPSISKVTAGKKKATVKWKKVTGATGYEVYMATSKKGKYTKIGTTTKNSKVSYTKTKLKSKKKYYFKVRTYKTVAGKKVYSSYSSIKSIKVK